MMIVVTYRFLIRVAIGVILACMAPIPTEAIALPDSLDAPPFRQVERESVSDGLASFDRLHSQETEFHRSGSSETMRSFEPMAGSVTNEGDSRANRLDFWALAALALVAFLASTVDAVAGGGGILTVPALLLAGLPPHLVLGTNKAQAVFGSGTALSRYAASPLLDHKRARWSFPSAFVGAVVGALLVLRIPSEPLRVVSVVLLLLASAAILWRPKLTVGKPRSRLWAAAALLAIGAGAYDGFFGPGTGVLLIAGYRGWWGDSLDSASANAKPANFASNLASVLIFAASGQVLWHVAAVMAVGQVLGGWIGAHLTLRHGAGFVRWVSVTVGVAMIVRIAWSMR